MEFRSHCGGDWRQLASPAPAPARSWRPARKATQRRGSRPPKTPVRARPRRLRALTVSHSKSVSCCTFVWARRARNGQKRRFPARAAAHARKRERLQHELTTNAGRGEKEGRGGGGGRGEGSGGEGRGAARKGGTSTNTFGAFVSDATMRPDPRRTPRSWRRSSRWSTSSTTTSRSGSIWARMR
jgi:hypothetical protein